LATVIKTLRLKWLGHVSRMEEQRPQKGFRRKTWEKKEQREALYMMD
jgi:hypothetical protein